MPKIGNLLKDISTNRPALPDGEYHFSLTVEDVTSRKGDPMVHFTFTVDIGESKGYEVHEYYVYQRNGEMDEETLRKLKRRSKKLVGDRCNEDDFDTAEMSGLTGLMNLVQREDTDEEENPIMVNRIKTIQVD